MNNRTQKWTKEQMDKHGQNSDGQNEKRHELN